MNQRIAQFALVIDDYDDAVAFYRQKLHFDLIEDTRLSDVKRGVVVKPKCEGTCRILLATEQPTKSSELALATKPEGVFFLFLFTDDFQRDYQNLLDQEIEIIRPPKTEEYGTVAVFADLYGNLWDLIEPAE